MEIWLKAKVHLWVSSSPFLFWYLTLQSNPSDSSRVCCSHRLDLQPNPRAGWAACTLLKNDCFKIFTQETRAVFSNDSKRCFPSPEGHKAATSAGLGCAAVSSLLPFRPASIHWRALFVPSPCSLVINGHPDVPSVKGSQIHGEGIKIQSEELILLYTQYQLAINTQATGTGSGCPKTFSKYFHF